MGYFLRDLPNTIQLNPNSPDQQVILNEQLLSTLHVSMELLAFDKTNLITQGRTKHKLATSNFVVNSFSTFPWFHKLYILDSLGILFVSKFFSEVYKLYPHLAIKSIKQAYAFNPYLTGLFITQALNRLSYAYFGLDYEEYRNHEDIKTRSVIEDFHSILGQILILPVVTKENLNTTWSFGNMKAFENRIVYEDFIIDREDHEGYYPTIFEFTLDNGTRFFSPFSFPQSLTTNKYGEFRALRNLNDNSTYLQKTWLKEGQNCKYEKIEIEKIGIENKFNYKELFPVHPSDKDKLTAFLKEHPTLYRTLCYIPESKNWYHKNNYKLSDDLIFMSYPKDLANLWIESCKEILTKLQDIKSLKLPKLEFPDSLEISKLFSIAKQEETHLCVMYQRSKGNFPLSGHPAEEEGIYEIVQIEGVLKYFIADNLP